MNERALSMLGLMKRAGAVTVGEVNTGSAAKAHKAVLIGLCSDSSENARHRAVNFSNSTNVGMITLPFTKYETASAVGTAEFSMLAFTDALFTAAFLKLINESGEYSQLIEKLEAMAPQKAKKKKLNNRRTNI